MPSFDLQQLPKRLRALRPWHYALALGLAVPLLLALAALVKIPSAAADALASLRTAPVVVGDIEAAVLASGTLQAENQVNVGAQASGQVNALKVSLGQRVNKGDLIAEIDATAQKNELANAAAALRSLEAQLHAKQVALRLAQSTLNRQRQMLDQDAIARADVETAEAGWNMARADVVSLEAQIEQASSQASKARADLEHTRIRAPIGGTVVAIVTREGQTLNSAQQVPTIVKLARLDRIQVKLQISEADVSRVKPGQRVYFTLMGDSARRYHARLQVVEPVPESASQEGGMAPATGASVYYNGLFSVPNPDGRLRIGMTAQATVVLASARKVLMMPLGALGEKRRNGRYAVKVLREGKVVERLVQAGVRDQQNVQIVKGLKAGEQVVLGDSDGAGAAGEGP